MKKIAFSGTLDPITNGHLWVISEARAMADQVIVFLSENPAKAPQFSAERRREIILASAAERGWDDVEVVIVRGDYTARAAKKQGIDYLIRGIRNTADFDYENLIQQTNVDVLGGAKTIFVMPPRDLGSVSSSFVRALQGPVGWHWTVRQFVPGPAYRAWILDWLQQHWQTLWAPDAAGQRSVSDWFARLTGVDHYGGPARHYHGLEHLVHGLSELRAWAANHQASAAQVALLGKAFWFHDAVYGGAANGCSDEEASAQLWLASDLAALDQAEAQQVAALIRATDHFQADSVVHPLKAVLLGADLAILGQNPQIYQDYASAIRAEYAAVPEPTYRLHRARALRALLHKGQVGTLFDDPYFSSQYNLIACTNLQQEIDALERTPPA